MARCINSGLCKPRRFRLVVFGLICWLLVASTAQPEEGPRNAAIASANPLATDAGYKIFREGGNAFDAAIAVAATLAVVEPYASGLGGGGFWLLRRASDGRELLLDARETAPGRASAGMYLDAQGQVIAKASLRGPKSAAIPGIPAALEHLAKHYGRLPLAVSLAPAIRYAKSGVRVDARYIAICQRFHGQLTGEAQRVFLDYGSVPRQGFVLRQKALAATLQAIASGGSKSFYQGRVARNMVAAVQAGGGIWSLADLKNYRVVEREPVKFVFQSLQITAAPLPSAAGLSLAQSFNILGRLPYAAGDQDAKAHFVVEALRRAYQDRARYMGDPDFVNVPVARLLSKDYAASRAASIDLYYATPSVELEDESPMLNEGDDTTHFSIVDREGNRVAATLSINTPFGSGFVAGMSGVLLNNEMDDFSVAPGTANVYRLQSYSGNEIAPGKRPLSSMSPTFVEDERGILILGTPGGSRIISMILLAILDYADRPRVDLRQMLSAARYHHQYLPDQVEIEPQGFSEDWIAEMQARGYAVTGSARRWGNVQAVYIDKRTGLATAAGDPRGQIGSASRSLTQ
ncbi:MAG TPA: gamma-glutamyltransferase [Burkholderiales bacterium]|nr:gamma-glutamyltransferase [Burkholderiales bacterium]